MLQRWPLFLTPEVSYQDPSEPWEHMKHNSGSTQMTSDCGSLQAFLGPLKSGKIDREKCGRKGTPEAESESGRCGSISDPKQRAASLQGTAATYTGLG